MTKYDEEVYVREVYEKPPKHWPLYKEEKEKKGEKE